MPDQALSARTSDLLHRTDVRDLIHGGFLRFDPDYDAKRGPLKLRLGVLAARLDAQQAAGNPMRCSDEIRDEAAWLCNYRSEWSRLSDRLDDLERSLGVSDQGDPTQEPDGSWSPCATEFYRKLDRTVDELQSPRLDVAGIRPLTFLRRLSDPETLQGYLWRLQTSDVAVTGRNDRDELGAVQSALSQLFYKDELRALLDDPRLGFPVTPELEAAYADFMRQTQHPRTGYWGPWYRDGDRLTMVQDLSFTFHHVSYRQGDVAHWDSIVRTTLDIRDRLYPNGWRPSEDVPFNDHNDYDVVEILALGWPHVDRALRARARGAITDMLRWCLTSSVEAGRFAGPAPHDAFYFGVRFLDRVGYWDPRRRFWGPGEVPEPPGSPAPADLARSLAASFATLADTTERGDTVRAILGVASCAPEGVTVA